MEKLIDNLEQSSEQQERLQNIQQRLNELFKREISNEELTEMLRPWDSCIRGCEHLKSIDMEIERAELESIIHKLNNACNTLNELKEFDMSRFNLRYELSKKLTSTQDKVISLIEEQISFAEETRQRMLQKNNASLDSNRLELFAMVSLWVHAEKKYKLKPSTKVGRTNKNPLLEFAKIISGIDDNEKIHRFYKKYRNWKENPETLP